MRSRHAPLDRGDLVDRAQLVVPQVQADVGQELGILGHGLTAVVGYILLLMSVYG